MLNVFCVYPHKEDKMIWSVDASGYFKVSFVFKYEEKGACPLWTRAWIKGLIPKINIFYWILLQNKALTQDNLQKRGINVVNRCSLCKEGFEDRYHLILNCSYSQQVWSSLYSQLLEYFLGPSKQY